VDVAVKPYEEMRKASRESAAVLAEVKNGERKA